METKIDRKNFDSVKCGICRSEILDRAHIYQAGIHLGVICVHCYKRFSSNDIELMANLFIAYGGYFGMLRSSLFTPIKILKKLVREAQAQNQHVSLEQINIRLLHKALLHGLSPEQYIHSLEKLFAK
ncbi:MAG: hypothetical protein ACFFEN_08540 [Candidatus Thorarchaeota archaeon]